MTEIMIYPVSAIMKFWHWFFVLIGLADTTAWLISIPGLIVTIRGLVAPLAWRAITSGRKMVNMRPHLRALDEQFATDTSHDAEKRRREAQKELQKEYSYSQFGGCGPSLIQVPFIMGLYQVLLRMARPTDGLEQTTHHPVGLLSGADVADFLQVRFKGVPLPAHVVMTQQQYDMLATSHDQVFRTVAPMFCLAALFSFCNMLYSAKRGILTLDYDSNFSIKLQRMLWVSALLVPLVPLNAGLGGPLPLALAFYWVFNSLWSAAQYFIISKLMDRKYPLTPAFKEFQAEQRRQYLAKRDVRWARKRRKHLNRLLMLLTPWRLPKLLKENKEIKQLFKAEKAEQKAAKQAKKQQRKEVAAARKEALAEHRKKQEAEKAAAADAHEEAEGEKPAD